MSGPVSDSGSPGRGRGGDDRPSEAVLDELLRMFQVDDYSRGADIDLDSPEVEELLTPSAPRPRPTVSTSGQRGTGNQPQSGVTSEATPRAPDVVVIDDLADVPYVHDVVDDDADAGTAFPGELQRVFIDDDSKLGEVVGSAEAARAIGIEPRLRQRRAAVRKAKGRKRLRWAVAAVAAVLVVVGALAALGSSMFSIDDVSVSNAVYSRDELAPIVDDLTGEPTLRADTAAFEERIEGIPWVDEARVDTKFPDSASIEIRERVPAATFRGGDGRFRVIDSEGRVLDVIDGQPVHLMLVHSENPPNPEPGEFTPAGFVAAAAMAQALTPSVRPVTEVIEVANDGSDVRLRLAGGTEVRLGAGDDLVDKLARLETIIDLDPQRLPARIDVSTDQVTVQQTATG